MKMKKKGSQKILIFTIVMAVFLLITVCFYVQKARTHMTEFSFTRLGEMTGDAAVEYRNTINTNRTILRSMAEAVAMCDLSDTQTLTDILNSFNYKKYYVQLQLLTSDHMLLDQSGLWKDVAEHMDFEEEAKKAPYLSSKCEDFLNPGEQIAYQSMPVIRDGETIAILYSVVALEEASRVYTINDFGGKAFIMLVDGNNGEILMDTWHKRLGNMKDYGGRDIHMGDTAEEAVAKMKQDQSGDMAFTSKTIGETLFLHYTPVGIKHLSAVIGVPQTVALSGTQSSLNCLYSMTIIVFIALVLYTTVIVTFLRRTNRRIYRMSVTDPATGLLNRSAYETFLRNNKTKKHSAAACIYMDANGLHELNNRCGHAAGDAMLRTIADAMRSQWTDDDSYRIGGDEFVILLTTADADACEQQIAQFRAQVAAQGYTISVGFACSENETGYDQLVQTADADMLKNKEAFYAAQKGRARR